ncbi:rab11 family-interacting protein 3 isoform X2 [Myxocyprinus asiaticus]|uniref:rab11 family-interacting protein 3 isoform X2 n=1 Tax=Myxocyprinus asiaticus TaxID=70543 RepID=UPI002223809B|nr:rab11 family-interacting protein 3 isoform X2 [Myxocyprinus asiaticus]
MEQVLSSPQGCSEWEVSGTGEWESDQNPLGFFLMDKDNNSVGDSAENIDRHQTPLSFDNIFQENAINLDDLFWASHYSGQTYPWQNGLECVCPEWETQSSHPQDLKGEGCPGSSDVVAGDLISFNSTSTSPTFSKRPVQTQNSHCDSPEQVFMEPTEDTATINPLEIHTDGPDIADFGFQTEKTLLQETNLLLEDTPLRNCEFSHNSQAEWTFVNENSQSSLPHGTNMTLGSEGLLSISPVEVHCTDTHSNPKPITTCQTPPPSCKQSYLKSSALPHDPIPLVTCAEPLVPSYNDGSALLPTDEVEILLPKLLVGGLYSSEQESNKPSSSNKTLDNDPQSQKRTDANIETSEESKPPSFGSETVWERLLVQSYISPEPFEEILPDSSTENTYDISLEMVGKEVKEEAKQNANNSLSEANTELNSITRVHLQVESPLTESPPESESPMESKSALLVSIPEHYALLELSPEFDTLPLVHSLVMPKTNVEALSELNHDKNGDLIPDIMFDILTIDSVSCEDVPSSDCLSFETDNAQSTTEQDQQCDPNSPDLISDALTNEFQNEIMTPETDNSDGGLKATEILCADNATDNIEEPNALSHFQNQEVTTLKSESDNLQKNIHSPLLCNSALNLDSSIADNNQESNTLNEVCQEQITIQQNPQSALAENLTPVDQLNDSLTAKSSALVKDTPEENVTPHHDSHNTPLNLENKLYSVSLQDMERSDCRTSSQNQVIPDCASNPDSVEPTPFTCIGDQLTTTGGLVEWDQGETKGTSSQLSEATVEGASNPDSVESTPFTCLGDQLTTTGGLVERDQAETKETSSQLSEATVEGAPPTHQEDITHQVILSQIDLPQEQQVSSVAPSSPSSHRNVFPCGPSLDREACLTSMENNSDTSNIPKHAEMTLDLCKASDSLPIKSLHDQRVPVDLINVPIVSSSACRDEEQSALRAVFQALDQDRDGFVHIEEFIDFARAYGAEQVKDLTRFLDPSGLGVISFEDFHRGISAISSEGSDPDIYKTQFSAVEANGPPEEYDEQAEVSDSAYLGSESAYSECETFTDEDTTALVHPELHEDVETDSGIENTLTDGDDRNGFTLGSDLNGHTLVAVIGGEEEHFEDFGESKNTSDLPLANQEEGRMAPEGEGDAEPQPHLDSPLPRPLMLLSPSSSKRLSSKKAARHLQQSSTLDVMGDLTHDILDLADRDITDKVLLLEKRVCELEKDSSESEEQHARLRQENLTLVHRANALEEQLKEQELRAEENLLVHIRKHRDALTKLERDRDVEIENLQARLQQLDEENSELRSCVPCLRANIERLEEEKRKLQDEVEDVTDRLNEEIESRRKMSDKLSHERHTNQKEKECTQGLIEDLRKQLEHLQLFKLETEARRGRSASSGLQEYNTHMRENELEQEIRRLKQDNRSLKEQNDELNGQIINLSIQGAKSLFTESLSESLAAEINNVSRTELMEAVHKQEEINFRLQDYIDRIIVAIMESNPSILEVK